MVIKVTELMEKELFLDVEQQFLEELGEEPTAKFKFALRMKYGLSATQLNSSEKYIIHNEAKNGFRN